MRMMTKDATMPDERPPDLAVHEALGLLGHRRRAACREAAGPEPEEGNGRRE